MGEPLDRAHLRRLALAARDDDRDESCALRLTPAQLALASALDPETVLGLLDLADAGHRALLRSAIADQPPSTPKLWRP